MVDSISGNSHALSTLLRAQSTGTAAGIAALKSSQQSTQAIINQLQEGLDQTKATASRSLSFVQNTAAPSNTNLPRGSLVDVLV
ncbi:MAG: hypothetical protein HGA90_00260 [Alphaproteobacteria bacterium]|nr:hypothetical protein [Alphaproteobacteria bacterium]